MEHVICSPGTADRARPATLPLRNQMLAIVQIAPNAEVPILQFELDASPCIRRRVAPAFVGPILHPAHGRNRSRQKESRPLQLQGRAGHRSSTFPSRWLHLSLPYTVSVFQRIVVGSLLEALRIWILLPMMFGLVASYSYPARPQVHRAIPIL